MSKLFFGVLFFLFTLFIDSRVHSATFARCPVTGETHSVTTKTLLSKHEDKVFSFCCSACKPKFDATPNYYINRSSMMKVTNTNFYQTMHFEGQLNSEKPHNCHSTLQKSVQVNFQDLTSSFVTMWLPMFAAMAIKIPEFAVLPRFLRLPFNVFVKSVMGLFISEVLRMIISASAGHHY